MAIDSIFAFIADWPTPALLFCLLNLMIVAIFIASNYKSPNHHTPTQLTPPEYDLASQLSPRLSLLQRVKSFDFSFSSFHSSIPSDSGANSPTERTLTPWLMDRVKSFKLTSPFNSGQHFGETPSSKDEQADIDPRHDSAQDDSNVTAGAKPPHNKLADLSNERSGVTLSKRPSSKVANSGSKEKVGASKGGEEEDVWQRPVTRKSVVRVHDESVDAKADDFIKRFKQHLKLQRLDSLQRLREMLNRGT